MRVVFIAALTAGSFAANLCGRYVLSSLLLVAAVAELCHAISVLRRSAARDSQMAHLKQPRRLSSRPRTGV